jgi:D-arabinose 1-dehydrogenase-like Zn-dependent alcohol dehydrogenase
MAIDYTAFKGSDSGKIQEEKVSHRDLEQDEVLVKITHSGVCGTDEHGRHMHQALGHEGVGIIEKVGNSVTELKP